MNPSNYGTYLVTQQSVSEGRSTPEIVRAAIDGGVDVVQLREKETEARFRYELGLELRELTAEAGVDLIVNDRIDIAQAIDADGVHVGQSDLPVTVARDLFGPDAVVGCSTSTVEEALEAEAAGADYLGIGAVYGTSSKDVAAEENGVGPERIAAIAEAVSIPVVGIGGITTDNAAPVVEAGAVGVSVISEITTAEDPQGTTAALAETVETAKGVANGSTPDE
ncbi:thiamine phosphate synthase [Natronorubrum tibetense]|uniref:Thiamine-phosphate synthase n=1 Tax=Natronorubrum tibetense GA33 TaxID=1114856 RepID=L9VHC0_9EURY|nr:thiamine phosphate synthase [Natronorubrum tibetense]ELY36469.1 thiamine-phosphate pyrophosphorylase [Natronorubrum tibetense GA33]